MMEVAPVVRINIHAGKLFVYGGQAAAADFGVGGAGKAILRLGRKEALQNGNQFWVAPDVGRQVSPEMVEEGTFAPSQRAAAGVLFRKNLLPGEEFQADEPDTVEI